MTKLSTDSEVNQEECQDQKPKDQVIETQEGVTIKHVKVNQTMETTSVGEIKIDLTLTTIQKGATGPVDKYETSPSGKEETNNLVQANSPKSNEGINGFLRKTVNLVRF